jgi:hypothetical protein
MDAPVNSGYFIGIRESGWSESETLFDLFYRLHHFWEMNLLRMIDDEKGAITENRFLKPGESLLGNCL